MENSNTTVKVIGALMAGAAIGAALGILFAPDKGLATRKKISSKGEELSDALKEKFSAFMEEAKNDFEEIKDKTGSAFKNGMAKAESFSKSE